MDQVIAQAVGNGRKTSHAARRDDHSISDARCAGNLLSLIGRRIGTGRKSLHRLDGVWSFVDQGPRTPLADHEMAFDTGVLQELEQPNSENRPGRAGDPDDEFHASYIRPTLSNTPRFGRTIHPLACLPKYESAAC